MGRILAIDYGIKRTGLAVTDAERIIAGPLATVETPRVMQYLRDYCQKEAVDLFVVGEARQMDNSPSESMRIIEPFVQRLREAFPDKRVDRIDERFTSKLAFRAMIDGGLKKRQRQDKGTIDRVSAVIMLQDYMHNLELHPIHDSSPSSQDNTTTPHR